MFTCVVGAKLPLELDQNFLCSRAPEMQKNELSFFLWVISAILNLKDASYRLIGVYIVWDPMDSPTAR